MASNANLIAHAVNQLKTSLERNKRLMLPVFKSVLLRKPAQEVSVESVESVRPDLLLLHTPLGDVAMLFALTCKLDSARQKRLHAQYGSCMVLDISAVNKADLSDAEVDSFLLTPAARAWVSCSIYASEAAVAQADIRKEQAEVQQKRDAELTARREQEVAMLARQVAERALEEAEKARKEAKALAAEEAAMYKELNLSIHTCSISNDGNLVFSNTKIRKVAAGGLKGTAGLKRVVLPDGFTEIGEAAFMNCTGLEEVVLGAGMKKIGKQAFAGCTSLRKVQLSGAQLIGEDAFRGCSSLQDINFGEGLKVLDHGAFLNCTTLRSVELPESLIDTGEEIFSGCSGLEAVHLPPKCTALSKRSFADCSALTDINLQNVNAVGSYAFLNCRWLPDSCGVEHLSYMHSGAFAGCTSLRRVILPKSVSAWDDSLFTGCTSLEEVVLESCQVPAFAFKGCTALHTVVFAEECFSDKGWGNIGKYAFSDCSSLRSFRLPPNIRHINRNAFENCSSLASMAIPQTVFMVHDRAFAGCSALSELHIEPITLVRPSALEECASLPADAVASYRILKSEFFRIQTPADLLRAAQSDLNGWFERRMGASFFTSWAIFPQFDGSIQYENESSDYSGEFDSIDELMESEIGDAIRNGWFYYHILFDASREELAAKALEAAPKADDASDGSSNKIMERMYLGARRKSLIDEYLRRTSMLKSKRTAIPQPPKQLIDLPAFPVGSNVRHATFGDGVVKTAYVDCGNEKLEVEFASCGVKTLLIKFAHLERIEG